MAVPSPTHKGAAGTPPTKPGTHGHQGHSRLSDRLAVLEHDLLADATTQHYHQHHLGGLGGLFMAHHNRNSSHSPATHIAPSTTTAPSTAPTTDHSTSNPEATVKAQDYLAVPMPSAASSRSRSRSPPRSRSPSRSPSMTRTPSPGARRCMAAMAAWTPRLDRRQSWDGQAYRRAMMVQSTGLVCQCHPAEGQVGFTAHQPNCQRHHEQLQKEAAAEDDERRQHSQARQVLGHGAGGSSSSMHSYEADRGFSEVVAEDEKRQTV